MSAPTIDFAIKMYVQEDLRMFETLAPAERKSLDAIDPDTRAPSDEDILRRMFKLFSNGRWCFHCDTFECLIIRFMRYSVDASKIVIDTDAFSRVMKDYQKRGVDAVFVPLTWRWLNPSKIFKEHSTFLRPFWFIHRTPERVFGLQSVE